MQDLQISIKGEITSSNFNEWKAAIIQRIDATPTELVSDEDFAKADGSVKSYKLVEKRLDEVKQSALDQSRDITNLFDAIDEVKSRVRDVRLKLSRQVTQRKKEIRLDLIDSSIKRVRQTIHDKEGVFPLLDHSDILREWDFESAIKGKSSLQNAQNALQKLVQDKVREIDNRLVRVKLNETLIEKASTENAFLFHDQKALLLKAPDQLEKLIADRIYDYKAKERVRRQREEQERTQRQKEEEERRRKQEEGHDRVEQEITESEDPESGGPGDVPSPPTAKSPRSPSEPTTDQISRPDFIVALRNLAEGNDPFTGENLPANSCLNEVEAVRLLYRVIDELEVQK